MTPTTFQQVRYKETRIAADRRLILEVLYRHLMNPKLNGIRPVAHIQVSQGALSLLKRNC